ncbi:MAG: hypothetical protein IH845_00435 [Nanoarchaeota archaeon]|nr:hypothetical protein [Nanoarchaeota archaeon]
MIKIKMENTNKKKKLEIVIIIILMIFLLTVPLIIFKENNKFDGSITLRNLEGRAIYEVSVTQVENFGLELAVEVPEKYQSVKPGETLRFQITIKNLERAGRYDIQLDYYIKKNDIILVNRREIKAIETQASFLSSIKIPENILPGIYSIVVEIDEERKAIATFYIKSSEINQIKIYLAILIIAILVVGGLISFELHRLGSK